MQTELKGWKEWNGEYLVSEEEDEDGCRQWATCTAKEWAARVKQQLEDKEALGIVDVEVFTDLSKAETIETFRRIKKDSIKYTEENFCTLGLVFCSIGFQIND